MRACDRVRAGARLGGRRQGGLWSGPLRVNGRETAARSLCGWVYKACKKHAAGAVRARVSDSCGPAAQRGARTDA